jgi:hypothetical protein
MKRHVAEANVRLISSAITNYYGRTGTWPCKRNGLPDVTFGIDNVPNDEVIRILLGVDPMRSIGGASLLVVDAKALVGDRYIDPWGMPYYIAFDTDGDGVCKTERWGTLKGKGPFVWSDVGGAITSWQSNAAYSALLMQK